MGAPSPADAYGSSNLPPVTEVKIDMDHGQVSEISIKFGDSDIADPARNDSCGMRSDRNASSAGNSGSGNSLDAAWNKLKGLLAPLLGKDKGTDKNAPGASDQPSATTPSAPQPVNPAAADTPDHAATPAASAPENPAATPKKPDTASTGKTASEPVSLDDIGSEFSTAAPPAGQSISKEQGDKLGLQVMASLQKDFGFTPEQAAGVVGNLYHESGGSSDPSGLNPHLNEHGSNPGAYGASADPANPAGAWASDFGPPNATQFGYGWAQWTGDRKTAFLDWAKQNNLDPGSPAANYGFLDYELKNTESQAVPAVKNAKTPQEAADAFLTSYERTAIPVGGKREEYAQHFLDLWNGQGN